MQKPIEIEQDQPAKQVYGTRSAGDDSRGSTIYIMNIVGFYF